MYDRGWAGKIKNLYVEIMWVAKRHLGHANPKYHNYFNK